MSLLFKPEKKLVPISETAKELNLPLHEIDTFTKWGVTLLRVDTLEMDG